LQEKAPCGIVLTIDADHSPFLSEPRALADALSQLKGVSKKIRMCTGCVIARCGGREEGNFKRSAPLSKEQELPGTSSSVDIEMGNFMGLDKSSESRVAVVTGASAGIGKAAAKALATMGWSVIGVGRNPIRSQEALEQIRQHAPAARSKWCR